MERDSVQNIKIEHSMFELTGDTYTGLNNVLCRILNQDRLKK